MRFIMLLYREDVSREGTAQAYDGEPDASLRTYERALARAGALLGAERVGPEHRAFCQSGDREERSPLPATLRAVWLVEFKSHEEVIEWARRCPLNGPKTRVHVHQVR